MVNSQDAKESEELDFTQIRAGLKRGSILYYLLRLLSWPAPLFIKINYIFQTQQTKMDPNQPRPPRDMDGLIKFCLEASRSEDAPAGGASTMEDMDPERRVWLQQALASMSVDVIKELAEAIKILETETVQDPNATEDQVSEVEYAFECIGDWIGQLDMAMNFHQIGGFHSLNGCLESPHDTLRSGAANAIAELSQNNPYCQVNIMFLKRPKIASVLYTRVA
jgi:hypothetical protein